MKQKIPAPANRSIQAYYERIYSRYDCVNSWITFGLDAYWRRCLISECRRRLPGGALIMDLCTGTGKTAQGLKTAVPKDYFTLVGVDFSLDMLRHGKQQQAVNQSIISNVSADARSLPFQDNSMSAVTISFATRNLDARSGDLEQVMYEINRVLKPNGLWLQLETAQPNNRLIRWLFHRFVGFWVPFISRQLGDDEASYRFLSGSILKFDSPDGLSQRMTEFGFKLVGINRYFFGAACLLIVQKADN